MEKVSIKTRGGTRKPEQAYSGSKLGPVLKHTLMHYMKINFRARGGEGLGGLKPSPKFFFALEKREKRKEKSERKKVRKNGEMKEKKKDCVHSYRKEIILRINNIE